MHNQADVHEFFIHLLNNLIDSNNKSTHNFLNELFEGIFQSKVTCLKCNKSSLTYDSFKGCSLNISSNDSLENALAQFTNTETMQNEYTCLHCKSEVLAEKLTRISKAPPIIFFHINRFSISQKGCEKINKFVSFPQNLNLQPYVTTTNKQHLNYELKSVIVHEGTNMNDGHYFTYVQNTQSEWYKMNDENVKPISLNEVLKSKAYIIIYEVNRNFIDFIPSTIPKEHSINVLQITLPTIDEIKREQKTDSDISNIIKILDNPSTIPEKYKNFTFENGLLTHSALIPRIKKTTHIKRIVIPNKFKPQILTAHHIPHFGLYKTYNSIREKYFWFNLYSDVKHFIKSCKNCTEFKSPNAIKPVPLQRHFIPSAPNQLISADFLGPFPETPNGNKYILSFIDTFTKYLRLYALPDTTTKSAAKCLLDYISIFGIPERYLTDKATCFTSHTMMHLCKALGVNKLFTTPQHPSSNGIIEKSNINVKKSLAIFTQDNSSWDSHLNFYAYLYNNNFHSTIKEKPAFIQFGYDQILPFQILQQERKVEERSHNDYVTDTIFKLKYAHEKVQENITKSAEKQENYQHSFAKYRKFYPGQLVYLHSRDLDRNTPTTKRRNFKGPFRIIKHNSPVNVTIKDPMLLNAPETRVHTQRIIPYTPRKQALDLFHSFVQPIHTPTHSEQREQSTSSQIPRLDPSKHAVFESPNTDDFFLYPSDRRSPNTAQQPLNNETGVVTPVHSPRSDDTVTYDPNTMLNDTNVTDCDQTPPQHVTQDDRSPYDLRTIEPRYLADRFLSWSLRMTE